MIEAQGRADSSGELCHMAQWLWDAGCPSRRAVVPLASTFKDDIPKSQQCTAEWKVKWQSSSSFVCEELKNKLFC